MLAFLQICRPLDDDDFFKRLILRPLKNGDPAGAELLRVSLETLFFPNNCQTLLGTHEPRLYSENQRGEMPIKHLCLLSLHSTVDARQRRKAPGPSSSGNEKVL